MSNHIPIPNKAFTLPSGTHYAYIHNPPSNPTKPTLLFLHGFPSTSHDWRHQINYFLSRGFGVLAPDLLGYGSSSKPDSSSAYVGRIMASDIVQILDHERVRGSVVVISHDWGTYLGSQLAIYYGDDGRFEKFVFMSVPYGPPGRKMDITAINQATEKAYGFAQFGYMLFLTEEGAGKVISDHWESFFNIVYPANPDVWKTSFAPIGSLKSFISSDSKTDLAAYISPKEKAHHHAVFGDNYTSCLNWYHRGINSLGADDEQSLLDKGEIKEILDKETLMITGLRDPVSVADRARVSMNATVEEGKLKIVDMDSGHWMMLEEADETNKILEEFFENGVGADGSKALL